MVKKTRPANTDSGGTLMKAGGTAKKMVVILSMILIGILIIAYKVNNEYWSEQFKSYNQYLLGASILLIIILFIVIGFDLKQNLKREFIGTLIFSMGALIISFFYARVYFSLDMLGDDATMFTVIGAVLMVIGTLVLMRFGGYVGMSLVGLLIIFLLATVHMMDTRELIQYDNNALQLINLAIICLVLSFILLVYQDLKFFYLAKLIQEERKSRSKKDYKKALSYCDKAISIYPFFATAWNNKGNVLMNMGKKKDALKCYEKALDINPDYQPAKKNLEMMKRS